MTNAAALKLKTEQRRYKRLFPTVGPCTCILLLAFILFATTQAGIIVVICLTAGIVYYGVRKRCSDTKVVSED
jgi:hypothetical protein